MKIALYIAEGVEQVVLTPESDTEKSILGKLTDSSREISILKGSFFECRGGWIRHGASDDSTLLVLRTPKPSTDPDALALKAGASGEEQ